ncbi:Uncharacterised protein [Achromobacter xylosoxidans]|nr:Uncharacterised protein [Achromobacter xylosoxidans]CUK03784.1 Uncharacterised protein [Achromobacter xylosoxidans]
MPMPCSRQASEIRPTPTSVVIDARHQATSDHATKARLANTRASPRCTQRPSSGASRMPNTPIGAVARPAHVAV